MNEKNDEQQEKEFSLYEKYREFDINYPNLGETEFLKFSLEYGNSNEALELVKKEFKARKIRGDNVILSITGNQGEEKEHVILYFTKLLNQIWGNKLNYNNFCFSNEEIDAKINQAKPGEVLIEAEHGTNTIGDLNKYLKEKTFSAVGTARNKNINFIFVEKEEQDKGQFLTIEVKNFRKDLKTNKLLNVECFVKSKHYMYDKMSVIRGILEIPVQEETELKEYDKRKNLSLENLKVQYGKNFNYIYGKAKELFEPLKEYLVKKNSKNEWVAKKGMERRTICLLGTHGIKGFGSSRTNEFREMLISEVGMLAEQYSEKLNQKKESGFK